MQHKEEDIIERTILAIAEKMVIAARTAPKARGRDSLFSKILTGKDIEMLATKMIEIGITTGEHFFKRDAKNIKIAKAIVLLGTKTDNYGLKKCSYCGFPSCLDKPKDHPCVYPVTDLGIAMGSAVSIAMDNRIDNRIMYTIGIAAKELNLFPEEVKIIYGIPLSATSKNVFFDR